jgi:hypothetical protein
VPDNNLNSGRKILLFTTVSLMIILSSCRYLKMRLGLGEYSLKAAIEWAKADSARVADSLIRIHESNRNINHVINDTISKITDPVSAKKPEGKKYFIVAGSFSDARHAGEVAEKYIAKGFTTSVIHSHRKDGSKLELVTVKSFKDHDEASGFLIKFKSEYDKAAWIFTSE